MACFVESRPKGYSSPTCGICHWTTKKARLQATFWLFFFSGKTDYRGRPTRLERCGTADGIFALWVLWHFGSSTAYHPSSTFLKHRRKTREVGRTCRNPVTRLKPHVRSYQVPTVWRRLWEDKKNSPASGQSAGVVSTVPFSRENANCRNQAKHPLSGGQDPSAPMREWEVESVKQ